jgi:glutamate synthase (NADPH/NADH) small chain
MFTKEFIGDENGKLTGLKVAEMGWSKPEEGKMPKYQEMPGTERVLPCELALLAIGFIHPQHEGMLNELGIEYDERGNVKATEGSYQTSVSKIFTAGDMRRGQSLVVWAIAEGREAARNVDKFLMGETKLEARDISMLNVLNA